jgi:hypothetical protein
MFSARRRAALSWNRGVPPLVGWVGMGILTVVLIVGFAAAKKKSRRVMSKGRTAFPAEHAAPDVLYLLGWEQAVQPRQNRNLGPDQVRRFEALRTDDFLPYGIGKDIGLVECEIVCDCGGRRQEMPTVLLPQRFWDRSPVACFDLRSHFGHRSLDATGFKAGDLNAEWRQLHAEVSGECLERRLRRRIGGGHGNGDVHRSRRGVDDPTLGRAQQRRHGLHHLYRSPEVHLERTPVLGH